MKYVVEYEIRPAGLTHDQLQNNQGRIAQGLREGGGGGAEGSRRADRA